MTEYIISTTNMPEHVMDAAVAAWTKEEIVRCRECAYYYEADNYHPSGNYTSRCCKYFDSYMNEVQPDGFCSWAIRRESWPTTS